MQSFIQLTMVEELHCNLMEGEFSIFGLKSSFPTALHFLGNNVIQVSVVQDRLIL